MELKKIELAGFCFYNLALLDSGYLLALFYVHMTIAIADLVVLLGTNNVFCFCTQWCTIVLE